MGAGSLISEKGGSATKIPSNLPILQNIAARDPGHPIPERIQYSWMNNPVPGSWKLFLEIKRNRLTKKNLRECPNAALKPLKKTQGITGKLAERDGKRRNMVTSLNRKNSRPQRENRKGTGRTRRLKSLFEELGFVEGASWKSEMKPPSSRPQKKGDRLVRKEVAMSLESHHNPGLGGRGRKH